MIFSPESITAMVNGSKVQTRRIATAGDRYQLVSDPQRPRFLNYIRGVPTAGWDVLRVLRTNVAGRVYCPFFKGQSLAVCPGRGKKAVGRIRITRIRLVPADRILERDALAEGVYRQINWEAGHVHHFRMDYHGMITTGRTPQEVFLDGFRKVHPKGTPTRFLWALTFIALQWVPSRFLRTS